MVGQRAADHFQTLRRNPASVVHEFQHIAIISFKAVDDVQIKLMIRVKAMNEKFSARGCIQNFTVGIECSAGSTLI